MSRLQAFGDEANKQALIADIRAQGPIFAAWLTQASIEGDLSFVTTDYGLHPVLARLLPGLGGFGQMPEAVGFYEALLTAIPVGADTSRLACEALLLTWSEPTFGVAARIPRGPVYDACEEIVALIRQSISTPVDKKTWRAARSKLVNAQTAEPASTTAVDIMLSLAWDLEQSPGVAQDAMLLGSSLVSAEAEAADEERFTDEEGQTYMAALQKINAAAMAAVPDLKPGNAEAYQAFQAELAKGWAADPVADALRTRFEARRARVAAKLVQWRAALHRRILDLAQASALTPA